MQGEGPGRRRFADFFQTGFGPGDEAGEAKSAKASMHPSPAKKEALSYTTEKKKEMGGKRIRSFEKKGGDQYLFLLGLVIMGEREEKVSPSFERFPLSRKSRGGRTQKVLRRKRM